MAKLRTSLQSLLVILLLSAMPAAAIVPSQGSPLADRAYSHPDLAIRNYSVPIEQLPAPLQPALRDVVLRLQVAGGVALYDRRAGRFGTLVLATPLVPGAGVGNLLGWAGLGGAPTSDDAYRAALWNSLTLYLAAHAADLRLDAAQLGSPRIALHEGRRVAQIYAPRVVGGVPVRDSFIVAAVNNGNLLLLGTRNWGDVAVSTQPAITAAQAADAVRAHAAPYSIERFWGKDELQLVPVARGADPALVEPGQGLGYRLAWSIKPRFAGDRGSYEALVDAHTGELLSFQDRNQYAESRAIGGVFPVSNDGQAPDGIEQPRFPMPFTDISTGSATSFANAHGLFTAAGRAETTLSGQFVKINDECGPILESNFCSGDLDLAASAGHDCAVPSGHSAGDTHSSRSGFYELNRVIAAAQGYLPGNAWLRTQLPANMNINLTCNAFWDGASVNFYRSGDGCGNTGEIAAVFDHEWGHGLDNNDNIPQVSSPGEAYADINAIYRLNTSCVGRGFLLAGTCGGNGDPCVECTGVREVDFAKRASGQPHDVDWILGLSNVPGGCGIGIQTGPCNLETHCEGVIPAEAMWDLYARDLQGFAGSPTDLDPNTALEVATRLFFLGAGNVNNWYQCVPRAVPLLGGGCSAEGGYLNLLLVDDDDGSLLNGTPHMEAIFRAFDRHGIACGLLPPVTDGCTLAPQQAPAVTATAGLRSAQLSWLPVPGATQYWVYRTEGPFGFNFGKQRIAVTTGTTFTDGTLLDGFTYYYGVLPVGAGTCLGPMSAGAAVTPQGPPNPPAAAAPALAVAEGSAKFVGASGDGDEFVDNCERGELRFTVRNTGNVPLTNVRIVSASSPTHPGTLITSTLPKSVAANLASTCAGAPGEAPAALEFVAGGVAPGEAIGFHVELTADELAPATVGATLTLGDTEADWVGVASRTYGFETDAEGWQVVRGTFNRTTLPGQGAAGSSSFVASSTAQSLQCDEIRSPALRLTASSTLALSTRYTTEPASTQWFDRGNLGIFDYGTGARSVVSPDGGRLYPASGAGGACITGGQPGWATDPTGDTGVEWAASTFSSGALLAAVSPGRKVALDVAYGTDDNIEGTGLWFDEVTVTNFEEPGADAQSDVCPLVCGQADDADAAVEYSGGWHRVDDPAASGGGYHRRMGNNPHGSAARVVFTGPEIRYELVRSKQGGTADVYLDGVLRETLSYASASPSPTFGHAVTYSGLGAGTHELRIVHRSGAVYVDGFRLNCSQGGASAAAVRSRSVTQTSTASAGEGSVIRRTVNVGAEDLEVSVVVEGSPVALGVKLLNPAGGVLATGGTLLAGLTATGLDATVAQPGTYTIEVVNALPLLGKAKISIARTVRAE